MKKVLITGGTGSLGKQYLLHILKNNKSAYSEIEVFSRDEAKQFFLKRELDAMGCSVKIRYTIGDVRNVDDLEKSVLCNDIIIHAAAMKQVPSCEAAPIQSVKTNILGAVNLVNILKTCKDNKIVIGISTDKACKPINAMGICKALQEKLLICELIHNKNIRVCCVRYGNVLASRGSVLPIFQNEAKNGRHITVTSEKMTRFFLSLEKAVETIHYALENGNSGDIIIPLIESAKLIDIAKIYANKYKVDIKNVGIRPGEKIHEILINEDEMRHLIYEENFCKINTLYSNAHDVEQLSKILHNGEYTSEKATMKTSTIEKMLINNNLL
jgi:FlaA1/EpsC-like NDP-sugar epimerase